LPEFSQDAFKWIKKHVIDFRPKRLIKELIIAVYSREEKLSYKANVCFYLSSVDTAGYLL
jgi:hypothetical protein